MYISVHSYCQNNQIHMCRFQGLCSFHVLHCICAEEQCNYPATKPRADVSQQQNQEPSLNRIDHLRYAHRCSTVSSCPALLTLTDIWSVYRDRSRVNAVSISQVQEPHTLYTVHSCTVGHKGSAGRCSQRSLVPLSLVSSRTFTERETMRKRSSINGES